MAIGNIANAESGSSVRAKLNLSIDKINSVHGWGNFTDSLLTSGSPLVVSSGTTTALTNNANTTILAYLPTGNTGLYNGTRLIGDAVGDTYSARINFTAFSSSNTGAFNVKIDISALADGSNVISTIPVQMLKGAGSSNAQLYSVDIPYFTLNTFIANGGQIQIESVTGNTSIYGVSYFIRKLSSGAF